jgi:hypothetical protein
MQRDAYATAQVPLEFAFSLKMPKAQIFIPANKDSKNRGGWSKRAAISIADHSRNAHITLFSTNSNQKNTNYKTPKPTQNHPPEHSKYKEV